MRKYILFIGILVVSTQCSDIRKDSNIKEIPEVKAFAGANHPNNLLSSDYHPKGTIEDNNRESSSVNQSTVNRRKKSKHHSKTFSQSKINESQLRPDSLMNIKIGFLRANHGEIDLNEPVSREFLFSPGEPGKYPSMIILSRERFVRINFDNDIFDNTDQFYTNGIRIDLILPGLKQVPLSRLMVPYWRKAINYYGISLVQNLYTPSTTKIGGILYGDRPYAAYLMFAMFKITNDAEKKFRQTSELDLGVIGPSSMGDVVQKTFHESVPTNNEPLGWEYQIKNDLILNYRIIFEKGLVNLKQFELIGTGEGWAGTLYTNVSAGFHLRTGLLNPYFFNLGQSKRAFNKESGLHTTQLFFFMKTKGQLTGYDATLQGGMFDHSSIYTVGNQDVTRFVLNSSAGLSFVYAGMRLDLEQFLLSPEMHHGLWHLWMHFGLTFCL